MCFFKLPASENDLPQISHLWSLLPSWMLRMCVFKFEPWENDLPITYFLFSFSVQRRRRANSPAGSNTYGTALIKDKSPSFHQQHQPFQLRQHPPQQQKTEDVRSARKQVNIFPFPPIYPRFFRQINGWIIPTLDSKALILIVHFSFIFLNQNLLWIFQVIKMLICVVILFLLCWGPRFIMELLMKMQPDWMYQEHVYNIKIILFLLPLVHAILNPVVYFIMSRNFRMSVMAQCTQCPPKYCCW